MSITYYKTLNPLLNLLINSNSARSATQILSIKGEHTFLLLNFLINGLRNSLANSLFKIFPFLVADLFCVVYLAKVSDHTSAAARPEAFSSKNL